MVEEIAEEPVSIIKRQPMLKASFFNGKRVTVFGLGLNMGGIATAQFLAGAGAREIIVTDIKSRSELAPALAQLAKYKQVTYVLGQHRPEDFTRVDLVIKNPVIPWTNEYVKLAEKAGVPVEMDSSIFFALCKAPIIGVTGTKGKTTTATLIAHVLEQAKRSVLRVGIGQTGVLAPLLKVHPESVVVFELSSWRLSALSRIKKSPPLAVLTNLYPDHLNYYKTMEAYAADKKNIFRFQKASDCLIATLDNPLVRTLAQDAPGRLIWFSQKQALETEGTWVYDGILYCRKQGVVQELLPLARLPLPGAHNVTNVLAATAALLAYGLTAKQIVSGIKSFSGIPHHLELVRTKQEVRYYNDTTATIPEAAIAALQTFPQPVILIAGGNDKRLLFEALAREVLARAKALILFRGTATEKLLQALRVQLRVVPHSLPVSVVETMSEAVTQASRLARAGDIVLLSPGATSFGIFQNEFDRGEQFRQAVHALAD